MCGRVAGHAGGPSKLGIVRTVFLLATAVVLTAGTPDRWRTANPRVFALTEAARAAPPEFAANGLLRLLETNAVTDPDWRLELAAEALTLARAARQPARKHLAPGVPGVDNQAGLWNAAYGQRLDGLSLALRAVEQLRRVDPNAAREAFTGIPRPAVAAVTCKAALLDDVSAWYAMAGRLNADPLPLIQTLGSHGEIAAAIDLIFQHRNTPEQLDTYAGALAARMRLLPQSDREFNAALFDAPPKLKHLRSVLLNQQRPVAALDDGWRVWMQTGLEAGACAESRQAGPQEQVRREALELFNATIEPPLPADLLKPSGEAVAADAGPFSETDATRQQAQLFRKLLFGDTGRGLSAAEKDTPEWRERMQEFIQSIEKRTRAAEESDVEYFYRQSQLWSAVLMAAPAGPLRERALQQVTSFLLANAAHIDAVLWYSQVEAIAEITRPLPGEEFARVLRAFHQTGHPVLVLYALLESDYPTRPAPRAD